MHAPSTDPSPIGVLDSGIGGLSILRALRAKLPDESFIYVADSANAPYGDRSSEFVLARAHEVATFLVRRQAKALVLACNTASVVSASRLRALHSLPIVAMEPAIKPAALSSKTKVVLVLATTNTIRSESVARLCRTYGADVHIILQSCPGLADQVEIGRLEHESTLQLLEKYMRPGLNAGADTIVLGCTHYAFLSESIRRIAGHSVVVIEPSDAIARQLHRVIPATFDSTRAPASTRFYASGPPVDMGARLRALGEPFEHVYPLPAG